MDAVLELKYAHLVRTRAYLKNLPHGLASYPECRSKGTVWKNILRWTDTTSLVDRVPPDLAIVPDADLLATAWVPIVQSFAGHLVLRDCLFKTDDEICEHFRVVDRRLLSGPIYKVMFALASPKLAVQASDRRFGMIFQGIALTAHQDAEDDKQVRLELRYPRALLPALVGRLYLVAFEVAVELAGGKGVKGTVLQHGETSASYKLTWS
ncbi:MAG: hypothetical protein RL701_3288 [Pseudomonadota bacterium]|jgi:hypothetical protein